jgi:acyl-CoA thioester hydrolase
MSRFSITLTPRISETDLVGHVNNVAIAAWFEDLRVRFMNALVTSDGGRMPGNFTLASLSIDFVAETHFGTDVTLTMQRVSPGNSSVTLEGELHQDGRLTARGKAVMVYWDVETRRPQRLPDDYRARLTDLKD